MQHAIVISSHYGAASGYPNLVSWTPSAELLAARLAQHGYDIERLLPGTGMVQRLRQCLREENPHASVVVYFAGYVLVTEGGDPALLMADESVTALRLSQLVTKLGRSFGRVLLLVDGSLGSSALDVQAAALQRSITAAHSPEATLVELALAASAAPNVSVLMGVRPWGAQDRRVSPFARKLEQGLKELANADMATGAHDLFNWLQQAESGMGLALGYKPAEPEFVVLPVRQYPANPEAMAPLPMVRMAVDRVVYPAPISEPPAPHKVQPESHRTLFHWPPSPQGTSTASQAAPFAQAPAVIPSPEPRAPSANPEHTFPEDRDSDAERDSDFNSESWRDSAAEFDRSIGARPSADDEPLPSPRQARSSPTNAGYGREQDDDDDDDDDELRQRVAAYAAEPELRYTETAQDEHEDDASARQATPPPPPATLSVLPPPLEPSVASTPLPESPRADDDDGYDSDRAPIAQPRFAPPPFAEPQFAESQFAESQFAEPQFAESQFVQPPAVASVPPASVPLPPIVVTPPGAPSAFDSPESWRPPSANAAPRRVEDEAGLIAAANAALAEGDDLRALGLAQRCLTRFPQAVTALQVAASVLARTERWEELANLYEQLIAGHPDAVAVSKLCVAASRLYSTKLARSDRAIAAIERACELQPKNSELHLEAAGLHERLEQLQYAENHYRTAINVDPLNERCYRRAAAYFAWIGQQDSAWNAASVLAHLGTPDAGEQALIQSNKLEGLPQPSRALAGTDFAVGLSASPTDPALGQLLTLLADTVRKITLPKPKQQDQLLQQFSQEDPLKSTTTLARSFVWTCRLLQIPPPDLYLTEGAEVPRLLPIARPAWVVGKGVGRGTSAAELVFIWARALSRLRPEAHASLYAPGTEQLGDLVLGALAATGQTTGPINGLSGWVKALKKHADPNLLNAVAERLNGFDAGNVRSRLHSFTGQLDIVGNRLGLLASGDPCVAAQTLLRFPSGVLSVEEQLTDLFRYAMSQPYAQLRRELGIEAR